MAGGARGGGEEGEAEPIAGGGAEFSRVEAEVCVGLG